MLEEMIESFVRSKHGEGVITAKRYISLFIDYYSTYRNDLVWEFKLLMNLDILHKLKYVRIVANMEDNGDPANDVVHYIFDNTLTEEESLSLYELDMPRASLGDKYEKFKADHAEWFKQGNEEMAKEDPNYMISYSQGGCCFKSSVEKGKYHIRTMQQVLNRVENLCANANDE